MADYQELLGLLVLTRQWGLLGCIGAMCPYAGRRYGLGRKCCTRVIDPSSPEVGGWWTVDDFGGRKNSMEVGGSSGSMSRKAKGNSIGRIRAWEASEWKGEKGQESQEKWCCGLTAAGGSCWARTSLETLRSRGGILRRAGHGSSCVPR